MTDQGPNETLEPPRNHATGGADLPRMAIIAVILVIIAGLFVYAGRWLTPHAVTPAALVNTMEQLNGPHPGFRRNHAKGVDVTGYFESNGQGQALSKAQLFQPGKIPVLGRFALAGGMPYTADTPKDVRSLAILFKLADGEEWRTGMVDIPVFLVNNPVVFREFLLASAPDPHTGKPNAAAMSAYMAEHPETAAALKVIGSYPFSSGFSDSLFYGLNAFRFVNDKGESTPVRWYVKPDQADVTTDNSAADKNYLFDALISQIHSKPLRWHLIVIVGQPGDPTAEAASQWPADRKQIDVGTITLDTIESDDTSPARNLTFDPLVLPDGISPSDDPLLSARSAAYSQSFTRREGEHKAPAAVSPAEVAK
jgi:catalase